jgi:hypothetical protein
MLRFDKLSRENVIRDPYPHLAVPDALDSVQSLNLEFPPKERFGPTIRMDGDLTAGDADYEELILRSTAFRRIHQQVYSTEFINVFLETFRPNLQHAYDTGQLLANPFSLEIVAQPIEKRVSGRSFVGGAAPFLYPRFDIGYGSVGYGLHNGGRGVHIDNLPRLISILVFLNTPRSMVGGSHRLYGLRRGSPVIEKIYQPTSGLLIASLQSNRAFHDVQPISSIDGERRAFYMAVSCSAPIWKKEVNRKLNALSKNRYDPPPPSSFAKKLQGLYTVLRRLSFAQAQRHSPPAILPRNGARELSQKCKAAPSTDFATRGIEQG